MYKYDKLLKICLLLLFVLPLTGCLYFGLADEVSFAELAAEPGENPKPGETENPDPKEPTEPGETENPDPKEPGDNGPVVPVDPPVYKGGNITVFTTETPVAGNYPQGLYKFPYKPNSLLGKDNMEKFTQTLEWSPAISKTFEVNTQYTANLTLEPINNQISFGGITLSYIKGLPSGADVSIRVVGNNLIISIVFPKTAGEKAKAQLLFYDEFEGNSLDTTKWALVPEYNNRQERSSWRDDVVSLRDGNLSVKLVRDTVLGEKYGSNQNNKDNWIRGGGIRTLKKDERTILYEHGFGYYEARIKFPVIDGTWGAFWLMSPYSELILTNGGEDGTEIDIIESIGNEKGVYNSALHWNGYDDKNHKSVSSKTSNVKVNIYDGEYHVFAVDWSPSEYVFYVDNNVLWRVDGGSDFQNSGINQNKNYIKLTTESGNSSWCAPLPANFTEGEMLVDYVRVYNQPQK